MQYYKKLISQILLTAEQYDDLKPKLMKMLYLLLFKEAKPIDDLTIIKKKEKEEKRQNKKRTISQGSEGSNTTKPNETSYMNDS